MRSALRTRVLCVSAPLGVILFTLGWLVLDPHRVSMTTVVAGYALLVVASLRLMQPLRRRVLVIGGGPVALALVDDMGARPHGPYQLIGVVDDAPDGQATPGLTPRLGAVASVGRIIEATRPDHIAIALENPARGGTATTPLLNARLHGVAVEEAARVLERLTGKIAIEALAEHAIVLSDGYRHSDVARSDVFLAVTRAWNLLAAAVALVLLAPVLAGIALLIVLDSPGGVFFVQQRIGAEGRPFGLIKFRTMRAEAGPHSEWVKDNASRITRVGRLLRRFRIDEWPQLVNVLRGEMNLVGPRPHPCSNYALFSDQIPLYVCRASVRPGITGWAQVRYGYANGLDEETEKMRYDLYYIKHRSFAFDLRILVETVLVVLVDRACAVMQGRREPDATWTQPWSQGASGWVIR